MKNITLVFIILSFLGCGGQHQVYDVNLVTCTPNSFLTNWKENRSPKEFWINVYVDLEYDLNNFQSPSLQCSHVMEMDERKTECIYSIQNYQRSMTKCLEHSRQMCKLNGCRSIK